jgi:hypothetical protein
MFAPKAVSPGSNERRRNPRSRTLKQGHIILPDASAISCVVRDISSTGARIVLGSSCDLSAGFRIQVASDDRFNQVKLIWQRGLAAGIAFDRS